MTFVSVSFGVQLDYMWRSHQYRVCKGPNNVAIIHNLVLFQFNFVLFPTGKRVKFSQRKYRVLLSNAPFWFMKRLSKSNYQIMLKCKHSSHAVPSRAIASIRPNTSWKLARWRAYILNRTSSGTETNLHQKAPFSTYIRLKAWLLKAQFLTFFIFALGLWGQCS